MPRRAPSAATPSRVEPIHEVPAPAQAAALAAPLPLPALAPASAQSEADFQPVSHVKVRATPHREETLSRERLLDWLRNASKRRLSLVVAEAGYGKSTLLIDYARRGELRILWYKLDPTDGDWVTFLNYLVASAREAWPDFGRSTAALLGQMAVQDPPRELVIATFIAELSKLPNERTMWIFDDFHAVDESPDVREIIERMLRDAPPSMHICLATRRRPELQLARLRAQGELAELDTQAMRFSLEETDRLFGEVYGQPLESDVLKQVEDRTEGWAASLQLLNSSIRGRSKMEIRAFVRAMSGAEGPLYDFLAEEVLGELAPDLRTFLLHASVLERITVDYVAAALERDGVRPTADQVKPWMADATDMGLLGRADPTGKARTLHPLLREFLTRELTTALSEDEVRGVHGRVGQAAPQEDWLAAVRHFVAAGDEPAASDAVERAALFVIGSGQVRSAQGMLTTLSVPLGPASTTLLARHEIDEGHPDAALSLLRRIDMAGCSGEVRSLVRHTYAHAAWFAGDTEGLRAVVAATKGDSETPSVHRRIAEAWSVMLDPAHDLIDMGSHLQALGMEQSSDGLHFYAGISYYNASIILMHAGRYTDAYDAGVRSLEEFDRTHVERSERRSVLASLSLLTCEMGRHEESKLLADLSLESGPKDLDVFAETAYVAAVSGDIDRAGDILLQASQENHRQLPDVPATGSYCLARGRMALAHGDGRTALAHLDQMIAGAHDYDTLLSVHFERTLAAFVLEDRDAAATMAQEGLLNAAKQRAGRWSPRFELLWSAAARDAPRLAAAIDATARSGDLGLLQAAEAIVSELHALKTVPEVLLGSIRRWPARWLPLLRKSIMTGSGASAFASAMLLEQFGTTADVPLLQALDQRYPRAQRRGLARTLARRVSPRLDVYDLGRTRLTLADTDAGATSLRRRSASLLLYLVSRGGPAAHREQVLEDLWPDADPPAATNSMNQTLYFLRRDIDRWYQDGVSADYVRFEGDLLWLDGDLVWVASHAFDAAAARRLPAGSASLGPAMEAFNLYLGRFAPEFEYEEWTIDWREQLHARYLRLGQMLISTFSRDGDLEGAVHVAESALRCDPSALEIERDLVWLYARSGATAAANEQYRHYATACRSDLAIEVPPLEDIVRAAPGAPESSS